MKIKVKRILQVIQTIVTILWQGIQLSLGWVLVHIVGVENCFSKGDLIFIYSKRMKGGISLGKVVILNEKYDDNNDTTERHEYGHMKQSLMLGPLYLFTVGIPSIIWAGLYGTLIPKTHNGYYRFYTERWADRLGGIRRI